jgi:metallo-beta-lactamase class B
VAAADQRDPDHLAEGHILIDGVTEAAAGGCSQHRGQRVACVTCASSLNTHEHFDHAGGIARLQQLSGAQVARAAALPVSAAGRSERNDPQHLS